MKADARLIALAALMMPVAAGAQEQAQSDQADAPRAALIDLEDMTDRQRAIVGLEPGPIPGELPPRARANLFRILVQHPELTEAYTGMGDYINRGPWGEGEGQIGQREKELMIMRIAWLYGGEYEWYRHYGNSIARGLTPADLDRVKVGSIAPEWSEEDRALLMMIDDLIDSPDISDATWTAFAKHFSVRNALEVITLVTHYHWVSMVTQAFEVEPEGEVIGFSAIAPADVEDKLRLAARVAFVEGPAWHDGALYFTDIPNNRIMKWTPGSQPQVHRMPSDMANGLFFDAQGRMLAVEDEGKLVRDNMDGTVDVLAEQYGGAPFNSLNDLALDTKGRIYFTDPAYNNRDKATQRDADGNVVDGVYRLDPDGTVTRLIGRELEMPNGVLVSPGDKYLWVGENSNNEGGKRRLIRYDLNDDGSIDHASMRVMFDWGTDRGPDGMTIDTEGNVYVAAGLNFALPNRTSLIYKGGIYVFTEDGTLTDFIPIPIDPASNVTFGGEGYSTLYVTAGYTIFTYPTDKTGYHPFASGE